MHDLVFFLFFCIKSTFCGLTFIEIGVIFVRLSKFLIFKGYILMKLKNKLKHFGITMYNHIVKEKASPEYIARGWAIGMFYGCLIPFGFQLICSIPTAFLLKGSKIGATFGTLITNHFTIFIIYPIQCLVGNHLIGGDLSYAAVNDALKNVLKLQNYNALLDLGRDLLISFFVGGALLALIMTPVTYFIVRNMVITHRRHRERKLHQQNN